MKKIIDKISSFVAMVVSMLIIALIVMIAPLLLGGFSLLLGFRYDSIVTMIFFFLFTGFVGFPLEAVSAALPRALLEVRHIPLLHARILYVIMDTSSTVLAIYLVENAMSSISASFGSILLYSFLTSLFSVKNIKHPLTMEDVQKMLEQEALEEPPPETTE